MSERAARAGMGGFALVLALTQPATPPAEPPAKNLKVLPKDWTRRQVTAEVMTKWTADLGVRCQHCHVGEEGRPFSEWDFVSDEKPTKQRARDMFLMLEEVNRRLGTLPNLHTAGAPPPRASCFTCHRGKARPRRIEDVFEETRAAGGLEAAVAQYRDVRSQDLVSGAYDFRAGPLVRQARRQLAARDAAGARRVLALAIELGLDSFFVRVNFAEVAVAEGDDAAAITHLEKALAMAENPAERAFVHGRLGEIRRPAEQDPP